jgi:hypothetical protein
MASFECKDSLKAIPPLVNRAFFALFAWGEHPSGHLIKSNRGFDSPVKPSTRRQFPLAILAVRGAGVSPGVSPAGSSGVPPLDVLGKPGETPSELAGETPALRP